MTHRVDDMVEVQPGGLKRSPYQVGEIVELQPARMAYTTIGMVIKTCPLECQLQGGATYVVKKATVRKLRPEMQEKFKHLFIKETVKEKVKETVKGKKWNRIIKRPRDYAKRVFAYLLLRLEGFNFKCLMKKLWKKLLRRDNRTPRTV